MLQQPPTNGVHNIPESGQVDRKRSISDDELPPRRATSQIDTDRQRQSSEASRFIGQKMLQQWILLNEICPNDSCYSVPLMRHPKNQEMLCVICNQRYLSEKDAGNLKQQQSSLTSETTQASFREGSVQPSHRNPVGTTQSIVGTAQTPTSTEPVKVAKEKHENSQPVIAKLLSKLNAMAAQVEQVDDPYQLKLRFDAIQACAEAIQACNNALKD